MNSILQEYKNLVHYLGMVLGPDYEIVLHELGKENRIIAIENGHISGREVGAPITNKALQFIKDKRYKEANFELNYLGLLESGKKLRSSTYFIKNEQEEPIGLFCINIDDSRYLNVCEQILQLCHPKTYTESNIKLDSIPTMVMTSDEAKSAEQFPDTVDKIIADIIKPILAQSIVPVERFTQEEKMNIVDQLNQRGVFDIKGSVSCTAQALSTSEASIYRYISKLKRNDRQNSDRTGG